MNQSGLGASQPRNEVEVGVAAVSDDPIVFSEAQGLELVSAPVRSLIQRIKGPCCSAKTKGHTMPVARGGVCERVADRIAPGVSKLCGRPHSPDLTPVAPLPTACHAACTEGRALSTTVNEPG